MEAAKVKVGCSAVFEPTIFVLRFLKVLGGKYLSFKGFIGDVLHNFTLQQVIK